MKILSYFQWAAILLILVLFGWEKCSHQKTQAKLDVKTIEYDALHNAKSETIYKYDTVEIPYYITKTKFHAVDSVKVYSIYAQRVQEFTDDFNFDTVGVYVRTYQDTLKTPDFELPYELTVEGYLKQIQFANYTLFTKSETTQHIVEKKIYFEEHKTHLYAYGMVGTTGASTDAFMTYDVGLSLVIKDRWMINMAYQRFEVNNIYKAGLGIRLF